jgi:hypothetical protein
MVQHSWPESLQHLKLHKDVFHCIPLEACIQFTKNCNELTQKLMAKDSPSSLATKGEKGESSAQFNGTRSNGKPFGNRSQNGNLALQSEEQTDQEEAFEQVDESNDTTSDIQVAFSFLQESHRNQHGCMTRLQATEASEEAALNVNGHTLVQVRNLMSDRADLASHVWMAVQMQE